MKKALQGESSCSLVNKETLLCEDALAEAAQQRRLAHLGHGRSAGRQQLPREAGLHGRRHKLEVGQRRDQLTGPARARDLPQRQKRRGKLRQRLNAAGAAEQNRARAQRQLHVALVRLDAPQREPRRQPAAKKVRQEAQQARALLGRGAVARVRGLPELAVVEGQRDSAPPARRARPRSWRARPAAA